MKKRDLEIILEGLEKQASFDASLEQYPTPATIVADVVFHAYMNGDVKDLKVLDLGCGNGTFAIAAALMGSGISIGYDISKDAIGVANRNKENLELDVSFHVLDVNDIAEGADTIFMNPPFGCQSRGADRPFLDKAMELSECIYSIHKAETVDFVIRYCERNNRNVSLCKVYKYDIPHMFEFHRDKNRSIEIAVVNIR